MCSWRVRCGELIGFALHTILNGFDGASARAEHCGQPLRQAGSRWLVMRQVKLIDCDQNLRPEHRDLAQLTGWSLLVAREAWRRAGAFTRMSALPGVTRNEAVALFTLILVFFSAAMALFDSLPARLGPSGALEATASAISSPNRAATSPSSSTFAAEGAAFEGDMPSPAPASNSFSSTPRST